MTYRTLDNSKPTLRMVEAGDEEDLSLEALHERARELEQDPLARASVRAYASDWKQFTTWCKKHDLVSLPATPETVRLHLAAMGRRYKLSTIERRLVAISQVHDAGGHESPTRSRAIRNAMKVLRRDKRGDGIRQVEPILREDLDVLLEALPRHEETHHLKLLGLRDRLMLCLGWSGGFRRSEVVALDVRDIKTVREGLVITVRKSKTDQTGQTEQVGLPHSESCVGGRDGCSEACPVRAWREWSAASAITSGPVFVRVDKHERILYGERLHPYAVARVIKRTVTAAGIDATNYAGHSLRAGLATQAAIRGATLEEIMRQLRQKNPETARRYIRYADLWQKNVARTAGL